MRRWSEHSIIALVMQTLDNSITVRPKRGLFGRYKLTSTQGHGTPNPTWIPAANEAVRRMAAHIDGYPWRQRRRDLRHPDDRALPRRLRHRRLGPRPGSSTRTTACTATPGCTSSTARPISANLGVNPSLTITAQAERAMSHWPNKGEPDPRPPIGADYRRLQPIAPRSPGGAGRGARCAAAAATRGTDGDISLTVSCRASAGRRSGR